MEKKKNFNFIFTEPDKKGQEWDMKFFLYSTQGDKKKLSEHICTAHEIYLREQRIYSVINDFTSDVKTKEEKEQILNKLLRENFIKDVKQENGILEIETNDGIILVLALTEFIPEIKKIDSNLGTEKQRGKCHEKSIFLSNNLGIANDIVTGYVFGYSDKSKFLHSWVELKIKDKDVVIDYTLNAIMNKEGYYQIQHAIPLTRVSNIQLEEDTKKLRVFNMQKGFSARKYLVFRDEIMRDLEKNKDILLEEER